MSFEPRIVGFLCNWCSYAGADGAGSSRTQYPPNLVSVRVLCSARVEPSFVLEALARGADGVLICGCHPGDCHYQAGNFQTLRRERTLRRLLGPLGIEAERVRLDWVSASEGARFAKIVAEFTETLRVLGPSRVKASLAADGAPRGP